MLAVPFFAVLCAIDPAHNRTLILYHETSPESQHWGLKNQDTGDLRGDTYFVLRGVSLPVECASTSPLARNDCNNPEQNATNTNVVSMNIVEVDDRYGLYASCNEGQGGAYSCVCRDDHYKTVPCNGSSVGKADVATRESPPRGFAEDWQWWRSNLAQKTGGSWYSTLTSGECDTPTGAAAPCSWGLKQTMRTIKSSCLFNRVRDAVVSYNNTCFEGCPQPSNMSSGCVVRCFFLNVLGKYLPNSVVEEGCCFRYPCTVSEQ
jgi:hypothetical protein